MLSLNKHQDKIKASFILLVVSAVLLVIAAFIEANLTIPIARFFLSFFGIQIWFSFLIICFLQFDYDIIWSHLAKIIDINEPTYIFIDKTKNKKDKQEIFNELFKSSLNNSNNFPVFIDHVDSKKFKGIQVADLISWSIFQYVENNNEEYYNLIENKVIKEVFED